nr:protein NCA1 [Ipomoea batatas]
MCIRYSRTSRKIGKYIKTVLTAWSNEDLQAASSYYFQALDIRRNAIKQYSQPSQTIDVAVSLAKVVDVDRNIGNEKTAVDGFQEAIEMLQCLKLNPYEVGLEQRV